MITKQSNYRSMLSRRLWTVASTLGLLSTSVAQSTNATTEGSKPAEKTLQLSAFEVRSARDFGYRATNSITATGIGTAIRDIPASISVITEDFFKDKSLNELRDVIQNSAGVSTTTRDADQRRVLMIRGFGALVQQNGLEGSYLAFEDVSRVEVIKGPSSVFHGVVRPGGVVNVIKNEPSLTAKSTATATAGSYDYKRFSLAVTGPLSDTLAYRIYGSILDTDKRQEYTYDRQKFFAGSLKWQPSPKFSLLLRAEDYDRQRQGMHNEPISHPAYIAAVRAGTVPYRQTARQWLNANVPNGVNVPLGQMYVKDLIFPYENFNPQGPDVPTYEDGYWNELEAAFNPIDKLTIRFRASKSKRDEDSYDINTFRPVAGQTPGVLVWDTRYTSTRTGDENSVYKIEAAYAFDLLSTKNNLLVGASDLTNRSYTSNLNGPSLVYNPKTDPINYGTQQIRSAFPTGRPAVVPLEAKTQSYYVTNQMAAFDERVRLMLGIRQTNTKNAAGVQQNKATPLAGAMFNITKDFGVFANYSETFEPNYLIDGNGKLVGPTEGSGQDIGVKWSMFNDRLTGTASVFKVERDNIARRDSVNEALTGIRPLYLLGGLERTEGAEVEFNYQPTRNYQVVLSGAHFWKRTTISSTGDPNNVGVPLESVPADSMNLWNKYTFADGALKGLAIGGGLKYRSSMHVQASWDTAIYTDPFVTFDAMISYTKRVSAKSDVTLQLNVNNAINKKYYDGTFIQADPTTAYLTVRVDF